MGTLYGYVRGTQSLANRKKKGKEEQGMNRKESEDKGCVEREWG